MNRECWVVFFERRSDATLEFQPDLWWAFSKEQATDWIKDARELELTFRNVSDPIRVKEGE